MTLPAWRSVIYVCSYFSSRPRPFLTCLFMRLGKFHGWSRPGEELLLCKYTVVPYGCSGQCICFLWLGNSCISTHMLTNIEEETFQTLHHFLEILVFFRWPGVFRGSRATDTGNHKLTLIVQNRGKWKVELVVWSVSSLCHWASASAVCLRPGSLSAAG